MYSPNDYESELSFDRQYKLLRRQHRMSNWLNGFLCGVFVGGMAVVLYVKFFPFDAFVNLFVR